MLATELLSQVTLRFVLLGAATGSLTGLVGLGIILVYRASGVLNFAAGALGGLGAFVCYWLRDDRGLPTGVAVLGGLLVGAALGALTALVMAYIRHASLLTKLIATLALLSAAQALMIVVWGAEITQPKSFLPTDQVTLFGDVRIGQDRLVLIAIVIALAVGLRVVYSRTLFGLATSAVAENRAVAAAAGWSTSSIEMVNFTVAGLLSAFAAILLAPIVTLTAAVMSISVIGALAAALVGRFSSFGVTVAAAMFIGVVQSELSLFQPDIADAVGVGVNSLTGLPQAVPLLIILGFIVASGRGRLERGETLVRLPLPGTGQVSLIPLAAGIVLGGVLLVQVESWAEALITTFGLGILVCSVVVVSGYAGQLSLCQYALGGFGAWVASKMFVVQGLPFEVSVLIGMGVALAAGMVVALPALRTRGVNLAVATLAMALLFNAIIFTNSALTGGVRGTVVQSLTVFGIDIDPIAHPQRYGFMALVLVVLTGLVVANVRRGRIGRRMLAVRSNERAAAALGINVAGVKLYAFALGAAIAALGGVVIAFRQQNIQFQTFDVFGSILLVQYAVIGGLGWVSGALAGAGPAPGGVMARIVNDGFPDLGNVAYYLAIFAAFGVVSIIRKTPDGIAAMWGRGALSRRLAPFRFPGDSSGVTGPAADRDERDERLTPLPLEVRGVTVRFGGVVAVRDVSFDVQPGEIVGLIGPNGAGKTTLLDVVTGFTSPQEGSIRLGGRDMSGRSPEQRARAGMSRSWQAVELFEEMTVRDNLLVACDDLDRRRYVTDLVRPGRQKLSSLAVRVIDEFGLSDVLDQRPSSLPQGHTRLVGIARAVLGRTSVVLLDEPAAGLSGDESTELAAIVRTIARTYGVGVLIVEHDVPLLLSVCDRIVALDFGQKIAEGTPDEISANANVISSYLGEAEVAHDEYQLAEAT